MPYTGLSNIWAGTIGPLHIAVPKDLVSSRSYDLKKQTKKNKAIQITAYYTIHVTLREKEALL